MRRYLMFALAMMTALVSTTSQAQTLTGTLKKVKDSGTLIIGYRENALPFSFTGSDGKPTGYSVDLCREIAAAVQALQAANLRGKKIFIAGSDTDAANVNYLCEGKQTIEVLKDIQPLAEKAAELADTLAKGKPLEGATGSPPMIALPVELVTKDNAKARIVDTGFHPAKSVPACK